MKSNRKTKQNRPNNNYNKNTHKRNAYINKEKKKKIINT